MGLLCSHGAYKGTYALFRLVRQFVCAATGGSYPPHNYSTKELRIEAIKFEAGWENNFPFQNELHPTKWYFGEGHTKESHPGLYIFLSVYDGDGRIAPEDCAKVIKDLEYIIALVREKGAPNGFEKGARHVAFNGRIIKILENFIIGLKKASKTKKKGLTFR